VHAGKKISVSMATGDTVTSFSDPQDVLDGPAKIDGGVVTAIVSANQTGWHMVFANCATPTGLQYIQPIKVNITSAAVSTAPAAVANDSCWQYVSLAAVTNADVAGIYKAGQYVSPRPATCAARIGSDGYSAWTFTYGQGNVPPVPNFAAVPKLLSPDGAIVTEAGVRFMVEWNTTKNIAFTSQWDNYPDTIAVPVPPAGGSSGNASAAWVLVAGSTNPMQTLLANAALHFHFSDGQVRDFSTIKRRGGRGGGEGGGYVLADGEERIYCQGNLSGNGGGLVFNFGAE